MKIIKSNGDKMKFYIVDVFAQEKYAGNQLAVIRGPEGVEQGYQINRPSLLMLRAQTNQDSIDVYVGCGVINVAKGELL